MSLTILNTLTVVITLLGVVFMVLSAIGIIRLPDLYTRVHAAGKGSTLGIIGVLLGVAFHHAEFITFAKMIALIVFFLLTVPVASHMIDRAAYLTDVERTPTTTPDDIHGRYDHDEKVLRS